MKLQNLLLPASFAAVALAGRTAYTLCLMGCEAASGVGVMGVSMVLIKDEDPMGKLETRPAGLVAVSAAEQYCKAKCAKLL